MHAFLHRRFWLALLFLSFAGALKAQPAELAGLDSYIEQAMADWEVPGLAVAVVKDGEVVYARGFGVRRLGGTEAVDEHTVFAIASNSKAVTATALGILVDGGKIGWDDPVRRHLPWFELHDPHVTREITIRDLLAHRVGHATWHGDLTWYGSSLTPREVVERVRHMPAPYSFRSQYGYSNLMYLAAGEVIREVTGQSWEEFSAERFFRPMRMTRTTTSASDLARMENVASPHTKFDGERVALPYRSLDNAGAAAAVNSSVSDWANWLRLQLAGGEFEGRRLVSESVIRETHTPQTLLRVGAGTRRMFPSTHFIASGLGWFVRDYQGRLVIDHTGGMDGMLSQTALVPAENLAVAIFTNYDDQSLFRLLLFRILDAYFGVPQQDWSRIGLDARQPDPDPATPEPGTAPSRPLSAYAGIYAHPMLGEAIVSEQAGSLHVRIPTHPGLTGPMPHWHYDTFRAEWQDPYYQPSLVTFSLDSAGRPSGLRLKVRDFIDPMEYVFERR
jgi:CubicO group peptidase (beta-lactamase class C family)